MNNLEEFEIAYNKYTGRDTSAPVERLKHPVPGITYKYQYANDMLAFWNAARAGLIAQLESAQKERDEFRLAFQQNEQAKQELFAQKDLLITANLNISRRAEKAEAELSAANEKLSKPVVLPEVVVVNISGKYPIEVMYASKVKTFIKAAGFTVEGESAPVKYIVILQRAWCNDSGSGINYHSDLVGFDKRDKAIKHGFELQDSDDFNIGVLTNGALTSFDWMAKPLAETKDSLARIASGIGIEGNADAS